MKALLEPLSSSKASSFLAREFEAKNFSAPYHYHPEYELTYIVNGKGKRYVGAHMQDFLPGDFVLLGCNLPHCWKNEKTKRNEKVNSLVIQFQKDFLGNDFLSKPELERISGLLSKSSSGLRFTHDKEHYHKQMKEIWEEKNNFKRMILLLQLLHKLSLAKNYCLLDKQAAKTGFSYAEQQRIHLVMAYIIDNFRNRVYLTKAASLIGMAPQSFCKYFKKTTRKTFIEAVTDYRVDYAVQQLIHTDHSIALIGFNSGFGDVSHFHKTFKKNMQLSPLQYRNAFAQKLEII